MVSASGGGGGGGGGLLLACIVSVRRWISGERSYEGSIKISDRKFADELKVVVGGGGAEDTLVA